MSRKRMFRCVECGGDVVTVTGAGRTSEFKLGIPLPVPADFEIPTCVHCGEMYLTVERGEELTRRQAPAYDAWLKNHSVELIELLRARHTTTLRHLERASGVTRTYFSKLLSGKKTPSLQLVRLLEAFEAAPEEVQRHLDGRAWKPAYDPASIFSTPLMDGASASSIKNGRVVITIGKPRAYQGMHFDLGPVSNDNRTAA